MLKISLYLADRPTRLLPSRLPLLFQNNLMGKRDVNQLSPARYRWRQKKQHCERVFHVEREIII